MDDTFRKVYGELSQEKKDKVLAVKVKAEELLALIGNPDDRSEKSRCLALAKTKLEESIMWAVKGITV